MVHNRCPFAGAKDLATSVSGRYSAERPFSPVHTLERAQTNASEVSSIPNGVLRAFDTLATQGSARILKGAGSAGIASASAYVYWPFLPTFIEAMY